jgi:hypothetical protein
MRCALQPLTPFEEPSSLLDALASEHIGRMNRSIDRRSDTWARQTGRTSIETAATSGLHHRLFRLPTP